MGIKLLILCFVLLAVTATASPVCKCGPEEKSSVKKYHVRLPKDGKDYHEEVEIDTEKEVETFHVPKTSPKEEAVDMVYDFKKNMTMIRVPEAKSCFVINSTGDAPKPAELASLLEKSNDDAVHDDAPKKEVKFKKEGSLDDRSELSDEMADLCKKLPIYQVVEADFADKVPDVDMKQAPAGRDKRQACRLITICGCVERVLACHRITGKCFDICVRILCGTFRSCN